MPSLLHTTYILRTFDNIQSLRKIQILLRAFFIFTQSLSPRSLNMPSSFLPTPRSVVFFKSLPCARSGEQKTASDEKGHKKRSEWKWIRAPSISCYVAPSHVAHSCAANGEARNLKANLLPRATLLVRLFKPCRGSPFADEASSDAEQTTETSRADRQTEKKVKADGRTDTQTVSESACLLAHRQQAAGEYAMKLRTNWIIKYTDERTDRQMDSFFFRRKIS